MAQPLDGPVVQARVRDLDAGRQRARLDGEAVVLRRDLDAARLEVLHRVIAAAVAELELERPSAERQREHLVAQADAEQRAARASTSARTFATT